MYIRPHTVVPALARVRAWRPSKPILLIVFAIYIFDSGILRIDNCYNVLPVGFHYVNYVAI